MSPVTADRRAILVRWTGRTAAWRRSWREHPVLGDVALTAGLLVLLLLWSTPAIVDPAGGLSPPLLTLDGHSRDLWWAWLLQLGLVLPLAWRRTAPVPVLAVIAVVAFVQWLAGPELYGDLAVLVAIYTVLAREQRTWALAGALVVAVGGLGLAIQRWVLGVEGPGTASAIAMGTTVALPVGLAVVARARHRALLATRKSAARGERARIAREMHDVVAHNLSVMVALADGARMTVDRDPAAAGRAIDQVARTGRDALSEMRSLLGVVRDPDDDDGDAPLRPQPGIDELQDVAAAVRAAGLDVRLDVDDGAPLPAGVGLTVHRVVQESLTNVLKHAPTATRADVAVRRGRAGVEVEVRDDGPAAGTGGHGDGRGLRGMRERVALHGGDLDAGPAPGGGWRVRTTLRTGSGS